MEQYKKKVIIDKRAHKEYKSFPRIVRTEFQVLFKKLKVHGRLSKPEAKKLHGTALFELRVRKQGTWRCFYAYLDNDFIVLLGFLHKKSQETPKKDLIKSINRLKNYE